MCKINGSSLGTWIFNPYNAIKSDMERRARNQLSDFKAEQAEKAAKDAKGQNLQDTASGLDNKKESKPITSLRIPLNTQGTGSNSGNTKQVGLNLTGG